VIPGHEEVSAVRDSVGAMGRVGVWSGALGRNDAATARAAVAELERAGYRGLWIPESYGGKEVLSHAAILLAAAERMVLGTGVANIWVRDAMAMVMGGRTLEDAFPGRVVLGLGVSSAPSVERRGTPYERPLARMRAYLDEMDRAEVGFPDRGAPPRVLAALGPRMLRLAAERTAGAHTYLVPPEHTAMARETLGSGPFLAVEQAAVLDRDLSRARETARAFAGFYLGLAPYAGNLRRLGWGDDLENGGSDRLLDAVVARGDAETIAGRVSEHLDAGADHVCVQLVGPDRADLCLDGFRELAPLLLSHEGA